MTLCRSARTGLPTSPGALANFFNGATLTRLSRPGRYLDAATTDERRELSLTRPNFNKVEWKPYE
jgi:hypothetical protein